MINQPTNGEDMTNGIHDAPDTPVEMITHYLTTALQHKNDPQTMQSFVKRALDISQGLDPYIERCSSPAPPIVQEALHIALHTDYDALHQQGHTLYKQKPQCCAGFLEGRLLKMLVAITGAKHVLGTHTKTAQCVCILFT